MEITNQNTHIYQWLVDDKSITSLDAMLHHGIGRLASRISTLVNDYGIPIVKESEPNSDGKGYHTRYWMKKEDRDKLQGVSLRDAHNVV